MTEYLDVITFRQGKTKAYAHKVGFAVRKDDGSISVTLDSLPLPNDRGQVQILVQERRERNDGYSDRKPARTLDDDVPF